MKNNYIIPANPGFFIIEAFYDGKNIDINYLVPIIGWFFDQDDVTRPVTIFKAHHDDAYSILTRPAALQITLTVLERVFTRIFKRGLILVMAAQ